MKPAEKFSLTIELGNAEMCKTSHVRRALRDLADKISVNAVADCAEGKVRDVNGNTVGRWSFDSE
jgi:hypothetical protein